jgi:hypothetical protein
MPNLSELYEYTLASENKDALYVISKYIDMTKKTGNYVLGGMIELHIGDNITLNIIKEVQSLLYYSEGDSFNTENIVTILENNEIKLIVGLIEELRLQKLRMNGLLRAIVFWLSPARKRAAEYVFHPSRIQFNVDI